MSGRHIRHPLRSSVPYADRLEARAVAVIPVLIVLLLNTVGWWNISYPPGWLLNGSAAALVALACYALRVSAHDLRKFERKDIESP